MAEEFPVVLGHTITEELQIADQQIEADRLALFSLAQQVGAKLHGDVRVLIDRPPLYTPDGLRESEDLTTLLTPKPTDIYIRPAALNELLITAAISEALRYHPQFGREQWRYAAYRARRATINMVAAASLGTLLGAAITGSYNSLPAFVAGYTAIGSVVAHGLNFVYHDIIATSTTAPPPHASPESTPPIRLVNIEDTGAA